MNNETSAETLLHNYRFANDKLAFFENQILPNLPALLLTRLQGYMSNKSPDSKILCQVQNSQSFTHIKFIWPIELTDKKITKYTFFSLPIKKSEDKLMNFEVKNLTVSMDTSLTFSTQNALLKCQQRFLANLAQNVHGHCPLAQVQDKAVTMGMTLFESQIYLINGPGDLFLPVKLPK